MDEIVIKNGDIWDIAQTVNGVSRFIYIDNTWYYYEDRMLYESSKPGPITGIPDSLSKYEYRSLTHLITEDAMRKGYFQCNYIGNINDMMGDMVVGK